METVLTAILVSIILNTATGGRSIGHNAAIAVGSTVALLGLFASLISGASMNPARTLGPDIVGNDYTGWWVYIAGPVIGAAIAVAIIGAVRGLPDKEERDAAQGGALPIRGTPFPGRPLRRQPSSGWARYRCISVQLACVMGVAAACDIAREDAGPPAAMITGLAVANMRGFDVGLTRPIVGHRYAAGAPVFTLPADGGIPACSDLLFLVRADDALAPVTHQHPGPKEGTP
jgi:hypothetical protein